MAKRTYLGWAIGLVFAAAAAFWAVAEDAAKPKAEPSKEKEGTKFKVAVEPKPLSENVNKGLKWLVDHQLPNGAWGQGEESAQMGGGAKLKDIASVGDTAIAALALLRSGSTPAKGEYSEPLLKATLFVCSEVEQSDTDSLFVTKTRGTRIQSKLGSYIDTFLGSVLLAEVQDKMPNESAHERASAALDKVLGKMQKNQQADGTWGKDGWAPTIGQGLAVKGLNKAAQSGRAVSTETLARAEDYSRKQFEAKSGKFSADGSAGVALYSAGANLSVMNQSVQTNEQQADQLRQVAASPAAQAQERQKAEATLKRLDESKDDYDKAQKAVIAKLDDKQFIAGFGSNGGEEFLSYMNIGESLVVKGGDAWKTWDKSIAESLNRVQNQDGSWSGHHCITGRTFCTAAALMVLMVDRTPVPVAAKIGRR